MDVKTLKTLEYDSVLSKVKGFAVSSCAKQAVMNLQPNSEFEAITTALGEVSDAYKTKYNYNVNPVEDFDDCREICAKAVKGAMLTPAELLKVRRLLRAGRIAQSVLLPLDVEYLKPYYFNYYTDNRLEEEIERCISNENEVSDNASSTLRDIRRKIADKKNALKEKLLSYFHKSEFSKYMQDNLVTIRNDRFVLPIKSEYRSMVPGLIHDMSSSGATVFIEPFAVVETNNEIKSLSLSEAAEVEKILSDLSGMVSDSNENINKMQDSVISIDVIFAKMNYSVSINGTKPILNEKGMVDLKAARHPLIDKKAVVPVSLAVGKDYKILMITGPNTGGKTVCLKTVGLICLMAYTGLFIPCEEGSSVAIYDEIFCDIGDEQSIALSLSTFSSHIVNLVRITDALNGNTLLLLDELGGGTDPREGAALAIGIIKYIEMQKSTAVITTHYSELKEYALVSPNILNASMQFDAATFRPTYKLMIGLPGTSNALNIASALGLNENILQFAAESMDEEKIKLENLIRSAENVKRISEEELNKTEQLKAELLQIKTHLSEKQRILNEKLDKINLNAKSEIKRLVSIGVERADELIDRLKETIKEGNERAFLEAKSIRKQLENMVYENEMSDEALYEKLDVKALQLGDKVFLKSLGSIGTLTSLPDKKNEVAVSMGSINVKVKADDLAKPIEKTEEKKQAKKTEYRPAPKKDEFALIPEVNVIGYTVSEAVEIIEPHLMNLYGSEGPKLIRIVHGKGTGALGRGIQQYLKTSPYVLSFRYGGYGEGDRGVTIVELKGR